jgi:hypothetical protein
MEARAAESELTQFWGLQERFTDPETITAKIKACSDNQLQTVISESLIYSRQVNEHLAYERRIQQIQGAYRGILDGNRVRVSNAYTVPYGVPYQD